MMFMMYPRKVSCIMGYITWSCFNCKQYHSIQNNPSPYTQSAMFLSPLFKMMPVTDCFQWCHKLKMTFLT